MELSKFISRYTVLCFNTLSYIAIYIITSTFANLKIVLMGTKMSLLIPYTGNIWRGKILANLANSWQLANFYPPNS